MALSDKQMNDPAFWAAAESANTVIKQFADLMGVEVEDLGSEGHLGTMVDKLTAMGIAARRKQDKAA